MYSLDNNVIQGCTMLLLSLLLKAGDHYAPGYESPDIEQREKSDE